MPFKNRDFIQTRVKAVTAVGAIEKFLAACRKSGYEPVDVMYLHRLNLGEWEGVIEIVINSTELLSL